MSPFKETIKEQTPENQSTVPHRQIIFAGEASTWDLVAQVRGMRPDCDIQNHYGPCETTVAGLTFRIPGRPETDRSLSVPLGKPIGNVQVYILDKRMEPVPIGVPGELYIGGAGVSRGYLNRPDLTAEKFVPDPFSGVPGSRLYRTGDLVRYHPDGNIQFLGRIDRQIKIRGYRIEPDEIEAVIKGFPGVRDTVVTVREDTPGDKRIVAYIIPVEESPARLSITELRAFLRNKLPDYMIPSAFVDLKEIPLNPNGKIDYFALPVPDPGNRDQDDTYVAPQSSLEKRLTAIWSEVLGIPRIGIDDNFFDLGGDSFKSIKLVRKIDPGLSVIELFKHPTIRELAELLGGSEKADSKRSRDEILIEFTKPVPPQKKVASIICVPYGGGNAITYQALANVCPAGLSLYAVQLPGHDFSNKNEALESFDVVIERCLTEIKQKVTGPVAIYGQCLGGALALELAYRLERENIEVLGLFEGGNFPIPRLPGKFFELWAKIFPRDRWISDRFYRVILSSIGSPDESEFPDEKDFLIRSLRHDNRQTEDFFTRKMNSQGLQKLKAPICCVMGSKDRTTEFYEERYHEWEPFSNSVELKVIHGAGHFFHKYQAEELMGIIVERISHWKEAAHSPEAQVAAQAATDIREKAKSKISKPSLFAFFLITLGQIVSVIGTGLSGFALGIWVYQQTGAVLDFAIISVFALVPSMLLSPVAGALADKMDRRKVMIASDLFAAIGPILLGVMYWTHSLQIWHIYVAAFIGSIAMAFRRPAYLAAITQLVPKRYLGRMNGVIQIGAAAGELAPVLGGILLLAVNLQGIILIDFITFLVAIGTLLAIRFPDSMFRKREEPFLKEIVGGWYYIIKRKSLVAMVIYFIMNNFLYSSVTVLITPMILAFTDSKTLGLIASMSGAGLLAGALVMSLWGGTQRRADGMVGFVLLSGIALMIAGLRPNVIFGMVGLFGFGMAIALIDAHWQVLIQTKVGLELQARVFATNQMLAFTMRPLAFLIAGPLADKVVEPFMRGGSPAARMIGGIIGTGPGRGMGLIMVAVGLIVSVWCILGLRYRPLRYMEDILPDAIPDGFILDDKDKLQEQADRKLMNDHNVGEWKNARAS